MKKFLIPLCAVLLAVGMSAFTMHHNNTQTKQLDGYFWYEVNSAKTQTVGDALNSGNPLIKADMISENPNCADVVTQPVCFAGFDQEQESPRSITSLPNEQLIRQNNQ
jgi:hypothetical protein